jgi:hypothetical protein
MAYGDITLRQYCDLDILIKEEDVKKSYTLFENHGYNTEFKKEYLNNNIYIDKNSDIQFYNSINNILIEVHWKLFRNQFAKNIKFIDLLINKREIILKNYKLKVFSNELLLVYLCMHGSKHCWERISWILDIHMILEKNKNMDWNYIYKQAKVFKCEVMLDLGLSLSHKFFSTIIPYEYKIRRNLISYIISTFDILNEEQTELERNKKILYFHYELNDNIYQKIKFLFRTIFPINSQDILKLNLSTKFYFLYYIIKPIRLFIKYIMRIK